MKLSLYLLALQLIFIAPVFASIESPDKNEYKHCMFLKKTEDFYAVVNDFISEISLRSNLSFVNVNAPLKRCTQMMATAEVDFMTSIRVDEYKSKYMTFLIVTEGGSKVIFYTRKNEDNWLNEYADLQGKTVGITNGFGYFEKFDLDNSIKKFKVNDTKQLPKLLASGRIDAYVTHEGLMDIAEGYSNIIKSHYSVGVKMAHFAIGKDSPLQAHSLMLENIIKSIIEDGTMDKIYLKNAPEYQEESSE